MFLVFLFFFLTFEKAYGGFLDSVLGEYRFVEDQKTTNVTFIVPNELQPAEFTKYYTEADEGVEVSVGGLRSDFGFLLNPKATHLLTVDYQPGMIAFRQLLMIMYEHCPNIGCFKSLKEGLANYSYEKHVEKFEALNLKNWERELALNKNFFTFMSNNWNFIFEKLENNDPAFETVNFLKHEVLYQKLHNAAKNHRMDARLLDLSNNIQLTNLRDALLKQNLHISGFNVSNVFNSHLGLRDLGNAIRALGSVMPKSAIVLETWLKAPHITLNRPEWIYYATHKDDWDRWESSSRTAHLPRIISHIQENCMDVQFFSR